MKKACIVPDCTSDFRTPSHVFPKNPVRRFQWLQRLKLETMEHAISAARRKIRICYKHFNADDYINSIHMRRLKDDAVPCNNIPENVLCIPASHNIDCQQASTSAHSLEFVPDIGTLQPLQSEGKENIRNTTSMQEVNITTLFITIF